MNKHKTLKSHLDKLMREVNWKCNDPRMGYVKSSSISYMVDWTEQFLKHLEDYENRLTSK